MIPWFSIEFVLRALGLSRLVEFRPATAILIDHH
jgi:hypothetical protein